MLADVASKEVTLACKIISFLDNSKSLSTNFGSSKFVSVPFGLEPEDKKAAT